MTDESVKATSDRAARGGGVQTDLTAAPDPVTSQVPSVGIQLTSGENAGFSNGQGIGPDWFGPLNPLSPIAPPEVAGRLWDTPSGYNLQVQPRAYSPVSFHQLRWLADGYDLLRLLIETRKDQMERQQWTIQPRDSSKKLNGDLKARADKIEAFFVRPDKEHFWGEWLRMLLEEMLVVDAASIYRRRTRGGQLYALDIIDGGTIKRVIDDWGRTPEYPAPAFQQVLKGFPAINYTTRDLIYRPRNKRANRVYGYSPVEQILLTVNIALRRQMFQLAFYTEGNIPESLIGVPETWTPDQIRSFQDWFDSVLQGDLGARRRARFVPGGVAKGYTPTKTENIFGDGDEWLARVCCFAFGMSPQPFVKMMNRATAGTAQEQAAEEGLIPVMNWVKRVIDSILLDDFNEPDLEFQWVREEDVDQETASKIALAEAEAGEITINEARKRLGEDPYDGEVFDKPMVKLGTGWEFIDPEDQIKYGKMLQEALGPPPAPPGAAGVPADAGQQGDQLPAPQGGAPGGGKTPGGGPGGGSVGGSPGRGAGASAPKKAAAGAPVLKAAKTKGNGPTVNRPVVRRAQKRMTKTVSKVLGEVGDDVAGQVEAWLNKRDKAAKASDTGDGGEKPLLTAAEIDALIKSLDLDGLSVLEDATVEDLELIAADAAKTALAMMGVTSNDQLVNLVNDRAVKWAQNRAAELVGKRILEDGTIIDNPSAAWAITESTRDMIRSTIETILKDNVGKDALVEQLQSSFAFSEARSEMIARTEIAKANSVGALESYKEAQAQGVTVKKEWILGENPCDECEENADEGPIDLEDDFPSGDSEPPAHPNCECALSPVADPDDVEALNQESGTGDGDDE